MSCRTPVAYAHTHGIVAPMDDSWWQWVCLVTGNAGPDPIEAKTGISSAAISRWNPEVKGYSPHPKADTVVKFARRYKVSPLTALVKAGYITQEEAGQSPDPDYDAISVDTLLGLLRRKTAASEELDHLSELRDFDAPPDDRLKKRDESP